MFKTIYTKIIIVILILSTLAYFGNNYYTEKQKRNSIAKFISFQELIIRDYQIRMSIIDSTETQYIFSAGEISKVNLVASYKNLKESLKNHITLIEQNKTSQLDYVQKKLIDNYNQELVEINKLDKDAELAECMFKTNFTVTEPFPFRDDELVDKFVEYGSLKRIQQEFLASLRLYKPCIKTQKTQKLFNEAENYLLNMPTFFGSENFMLDNGDKSKEFFYEYNRLLKLYNDSFGYKISRENSSINLKILTLKHKLETESVFDQIISQNNLQKNLSTGLYE